VAGCFTLFFRELVHFLKHLGEAFHEGGKTFILVIPPPVYPGYVLNKHLL
jgi:hypothetical protein